MFALMKSSHMTYLVTLVSSMDKENTGHLEAKEIYQWLLTGEAQGRYLCQAVLSVY